MKIKVAEKKDLSILNQIQSLCFDKNTYEDLDFLITNDPYIILIAEEDNHIVGYLSASLSYETSDLLQICVLKEFRNKNYATKLLENYFKILKSKNIYDVLLEVNENNIPALKLYQKLGFEIINARKNYYGKDSAIIMKKHL